MPQRRADAARPSPKERPEEEATHDEEAEAQRAWALALVETAKQPRVGKDRSDRANAAREIVEQGTVAIRGLFKYGASPDPAESVCLGALLDSLQRIVDGDDPREALHMDAGGRFADDLVYMRDLGLFIDVGRATDDLREAGAQTRKFSAGVIEQAKNATAEKHAAEKPKVDRATVDAAWKAFGRAHGWECMKAGMRGKPRPKKKPK